MELQRIEGRVIQIVDAVLAGRRIEDDRVELKSEWPVAEHKTARQIAGHANKCGGEPILWIIGLDENRRRLTDTGDVELSNWWARTRRWFAEESPSLRYLLITVRPGLRVAALQFETERAPYVVTTEGGGKVQREVPWREGNATRSAHRHELLRSLLDQVAIPRLEVVGGELDLHRRHARRSLHGGYEDEYGSRSELISTSSFVGSRSLSRLQHPPCFRSTANDSRSGAHTWKTSS